jgi:tetratricopeptide (TPR) repeat protein
VLILLILIGAGIYLLIQIRRQDGEPTVVLTPTPTRTAASYVFEAEDLYWEGRLREAIAMYERAIDLDADSIEPYAALARLLAFEGQTIEAVQRAEEAVDRAPENARAWAVLGMTYDWHGEVERAIGTCQHAVELAPDLAEAYAYLAEAYADNVNWSEAVESAETALKLDDQSVDVLRNYGYVMEVQGNYTRALEAYEQALTIHPNLVHLHLSVGKNHLALGNYERAIASFEKAAGVDPESAEAYYRLGRAYFDEGRPDEAQEYLKKATEFDPRFGPAFGYLAFTYWSRRNYEDAIPNLQRAITLESWTARRKARRFVVSVESRQGDLVSPSSSVVMGGAFAPVSLEDTDTLQASLSPSVEGEAWQGSRGSVTMDTRTGLYTVTLEAMPATRNDQAYVGWFEGVRTLAGTPFTTGLLELDDGSLDQQFEATWVEGPRIDYFYTLGLAHFFLDECDKAYPLFEAALQIDPEDQNALRGVELCNQAESQ